MVSLVAQIPLAGSLRAQVPPERAPDLADQVRRLEKVAAQKVEAELRDSLREADRLARSNPAKALARLKSALAGLDEDTLLPQERRDALKRMLKDRIRVAEADLSGDKDKKQAPAAGRRSDQEKQTDEGRQIRQGLSTINKLQEDGKTDEASRQAGDLSRRFPANVPVQASERTASAADQVANARRLQKERERRLLGGFRDIDRSALPSGGDIEFPKDWKERTKGRTATVQLTETEKEILRQLNAPMSVKFKDSRLGDVIEYLRTRAGVNILLGPDALKEVETSFDAPITLDAKGLTLRTILRKVLADLDLSYVIRGEAIEIVSSQRAKDLMVVRRYYVGDVLANMAAMPPLGVLSPLMPWQLQLANQQLQAQQSAAQATETVKSLIEMIQNSVDPRSWQANGGNGSITFHAPSMSLIVKQSAEVHAMLGNSGMLK
jgi:general secretion pathway protein D